MVTNSLLWQRQLNGQANRVLGIVVAGLAVAVSVVAPVTLTAAKATVRATPIRSASPDGLGASAITRGWHPTYLDPAADTPLTILAIAGNDAWAAGGKLVAETGPIGVPVYAPVLVRWNGRHWATARPPQPVPDGGAELNTIAASSSKDVWAFGTAPEPLANNGPYPARWNGNTWRLNTQLTRNQFILQFAPVSSRNIWAVTSTGYQAPWGVAHWNGSSWRP
jgi:hypothetical protein